MESFCKAIAQEIYEQVKKDVIGINLKNVAESLVSEKFKNTLEKYLNTKTDHTVMIESSKDQDKKSFSSQTKLITSTHKGRIVFIVLMIILIAGSVLMCTGYWWGIIGVFFVTVFWIKGIVGHSTSNVMNLYSLKLKFYFTIMQVPPRENNCSNMKFILIQHQIKKDQNVEEFFNQIVVEKFQSSVGIVNVEKLIKWSKISQRIFGIIASIVGAFYYWSIMIAVIPTSSIAAVLTVIYRSLAIMDEDISIKDKAECLENIRLFHRFIKNENVWFVILLDQASIHGDQRSNFLRQLEDFELNNMVLVVNDAPTTFPYKVINFDPAKVHTTNLLREDHSGISSNEKKINDTDPTGDVSIILHHAVKVEGDHINVNTHDPYLEGHSGIGSNKKTINDTDPTSDASINQYHDDESENKPEFKKDEMIGHTIYTPNVAHNITYHSRVIAHDCRILEYDISQHELDQLFQELK
ncbi:uncharacterized protein LOC144427363 [Styela clava]